MLVLEDHSDTIASRFLSTFMSRKTVKWSMKSRSRINTLCLPNPENGGRNIDRSIFSHTVPKSAGANANVSVVFDN